jgi:phage-related baseplate assembly protein
LPEAPEATIAAMQAGLAAAWTREMLLGRDVTISWLIARLMADGVHRVNLVSPAADIAVPFNRAAALGAVTITKTGRAY